MIKAGLSDIPPETFSCETAKSFTFIRFYLALKFSKTRSTNSSLLSYLLVSKNFPFYTEKVYFGSFVDIFTSQISLTMDKAINIFTTIANLSLVIQKFTKITIT